MNGFFIMYGRFNWLSIFAIFMLFVLGGLVRSTGSGMGCPDWPKCFGEYIPPTSVDQLPADYQEYFTEQRRKKTTRFTQLLRNLGMEEKASQIESDPGLYTHHEYNTSKAYIEYINRLWGAATGIIVLLCLIFSFSYIKTNSAVFLYSLLGFVLVMVNALLGAVVVNTNLLSGIVTAHFLLAFASIAFFMLARSKWKQNRSDAVNSRISWIAIFTLLVIVMQIVFGTQLREVYEMVISQSDNIHTSPDFPQKVLGQLFDFHLYGSIATLLTVAFQMVQLFQFKKWVRIGVMLTVLTALQLVFGALIIYNIIEPISKLFHISIGAGIFVVQFYICTRLVKPKNLLQKS